MKRLFFIPLVVAVSACSGTSEISKYRNQYCYTNEDIKVTDGNTVNSETRVLCSDMPNTTLVYTGIAESCGSNLYFPNTRQGQTVRHSTVCKMKNGISDYQIVPNY